MDGRTNNDDLLTEKQLIIYYNQNVPMYLGFDNSTADSCAIRNETDIAIHSK